MTLGTKTLYIFRLPSPLYGSGLNLTGYFTSHVHVLVNTPHGEEIM